MIETASIMYELLVVFASDPEYPLVLTKPGRFFSPALLTRPYFFLLSYDTKLTAIRQQTWKKNWPGIAHRLQRFRFELAGIERLNRVRVISPYFYTYPWSLVVLIADDGD